MFQIRQINDSALQRQVLLLADGTPVTMVMSYSDLQYCWFIKELTYGTWTTKGLRIVNSPNMLYQFKNEIPFGLACITVGDREPTQKQDFSSLNSILYILTEAEVEEYAGYLSGSIPA